MVFNYWVHYLLKYNITNMCIVFYLANAQQNWVCKSFKKISDCPYLYSSFCVSMITYTYLFNPASCSDSDSVRTTMTCVSGCPPSDDYCLTPWVCQLTCFQYHLLFYEMIITHSKERIHEIYARLRAMSFIPFTVCR